MASNLEKRLASLRGQVRRLLATHGLALVACGLISGIILAGLLDWLIHLVPMLRLLLLVGVIAAAGWLTFQYVLRPLVVRFNDLDVALKIEQRWPGLNDRLASTVQFLHARPDDPALGSAALRDATVQQTLEETKDLDFRQAIDTTPVKRAMGYAAGAVGLAALLLVFAPMSSNVALTRLFKPYGHLQWPRSTHLTIVESETPHRVAKGESFTLAVAVAKGESIPSSAKAIYTFDDGDTATEALRSTDDGVFRGRIDTVTRDFTFTVQAGDDQTEPWNVVAVPPPSLTKLEVKLTPPAYTGLATQTLAPGNTSFKAVEGTTITLTGQANKPLASATLRVGEGTSPDPVQIDADGTNVVGKLVVKQSAGFWFELKDKEGFKNQDVIRYDLRALPDEAPRVAVEDPATDRDVPALATVPIKIVVDDDYGIQGIRLVYKVAQAGSEPTGEQVIPLWDAQGRAEGGPSKHEEPIYKWDIAALKLSAGSMITFFADARDFDTVKGPNIGKSREIRLRIISDEDAARQLEERQRELREEIARTLEMQNQARQPVDDALRNLKTNDKLTQNNRESLRNAELTQRQVTSRIAGKSDGIRDKLDRMVNDLDNFRLKDPDTERQLRTLRDAVQRIEERHLDAAEQELARAEKMLNQSDGADQKNAPSDQGKTPPTQSRQQPGQQGAQAQPQSKGEPSQSPQAKSQAGAQGKSASDASKQQTKDAAAPSGENQPDNQGDASKGDQSKSGDASKGDQSKSGAQSKGDQSKSSDSAKSKSGAQSKSGDASKGDQSKSGDASKGDQSKSGDASKGDQSKSGDASKGDQSKSGDSSKGAQSKSAEASKGGDQSKSGAQSESGDSSKGDQSKSGQSPQQGGEQAGQPQQGGQKPEQGQQGRPEGGDPKESLAQARDQQKAISDELKKMLDDLGQFDSYQGVLKEAKNVLNKQEQAMKQSAEAAGNKDLTGKTPEQLTPEQKTDLDNLGARQAELSKNVQNLEAKLEEMAKAIEPNDPLGASALRQAAEQSRKQATAAKMGEAAEQLSKNQMGQARQGQEQARQDLKDMVNSIENRAEKELARFVKELKQAEAELKKLQERQLANLKKTQQARQNPDAKERDKQLQQLGKEQAEIEKELKRQLQKLAKLNAKRAGQAGERAASRMSKSKQNLDQDQGEQAEGEQEEALDDLKEAQEELAQDRRDAEERLANEQIAKMGDALKSISERQNKIVDETTAYEKKRAENAGKLTVAQRGSVRELSRVQEGLKDETVELLERIGEGAPVFSLTLKRAMKGMDDASKRLTELKTDDETIKAEQVAANRYKQLLESLKPDRKGAGGQQGGQQQGGQGGQQGGQGGQGDGFPAAAQMKMLKTLQEEINEKTEVFDEIKRRNKPLSPEQATEMTKLEEDQGTLADILRDLTRPRRDDGEE